MSDLEKATDRNFAENVRAQRERAGYSKAEFVRLLASLGWSSAHQTTLTRIEEGERPARLGEARLIAQALRIPLQTLMLTPETLDIGTRIRKREVVLGEIGGAIRQNALDFVILAHDQKADLERVPDDLPEARLARTGEKLRSNGDFIELLVRDGKEHGDAAIAEPGRYARVLQQARDRVSRALAVKPSSKVADSDLATHWEQSNVPDDADT